MPCCVRLACHRATFTLTQRGQRSWLRRARAGGRSDRRSDLSDFLNKLGVFVHGHMHHLSLRRDAADCTPALAPAPAPDSRVMITADNFDLARSTFGGRTLFNRVRETLHSIFRVRIEIPREGPPLVHRAAPGAPVSPTVGATFAAGAPASSGTPADAGAPPCSAGGAHSAGCSAAVGTPVPSPLAGGEAGPVAQSTPTGGAAPTPMLSNVAGQGGAAARPIDGPSARTRHIARRVGIVQPATPKATSTGAAAPPPLPDKPTLTTGVSGTVAIPEETFIKLRAQFQNPEHIQSFFGLGATDEFVQKVSAALCDDTATGHARFDATSIFNLVGRLYPPRPPAHTKVIRLPMVDESPSSNEGVFRMLLQTRPARGGRTASHIHRELVRPAHARVHHEPRAAHQARRVDRHGAPQL